MGQAGGLGGEGGLRAAQAEVLAPKALRTRVLGEIKKAAKLYRK